MLYSPRVMDTQVDTREWRARGFPLTGFRPIGGSAHPTVALLSATPLPHARGSGFFTAAKGSSLEVETSFAFPTGIRPWSTT